MARNVIKHRTVDRPPDEWDFDHVALGTHVITPFGPGTVTNVLIVVRPQAKKKKSVLLPPEIEVTLEEPWQGQIAVSVPINDIEIPGDDKGPVFREPAKALWPNQVEVEPTQTLKPTQGATMTKISDLLQAAKITDIGKDIGKGKQPADTDDADPDIDLISEDDLLNMMEPDGADEPGSGKSDGPGASDTYSTLFEYPSRDPNGPSWWTQLYERPPFINRVWRQSRVSEIMKRARAEAPATVDFGWKKGLGRDWQNTIGFAAWKTIKTFPRETSAKKKAKELGVGWKAVKIWGKLPQGRNEHKWAVLNGKNHALKK